MLPSASNHDGNQGSNMQTYMWTYADGNSLVSLGTGEIKLVDWDSEEEAKK